MKDQKFYDKITYRSLETLMTSTWAEATLQGLQEMWDLPQKECIWAVAGYQGAIAFGQTTCGLLIGCATAIGLKFGQEKKGTPMENKKTRDQAIRVVNDLYKAFYAEFDSTECKALTTCDFGKKGEFARYLEEQLYNDSCLKFHKYVMNRFIELDKQEKL